MHDEFVAGGPLTSPAEYVRREGAAVSGATTASLVVVAVSVINLTLTGAARGAGVIGGVVVVAAALTAPWLRLRPVRRAWVEEVRGTAVAEPLTEAERLVLRRGLGRQRVAGIISLVAAAVIVGIVVTVVRFLGRPEVTSTSAGATAVTGGVLALLVLFAAWTGWIALRRVRVAGRLLRHLDGPAAAGMRVRGPLAARGSFVPRLGGLPLIVLDPAWRRSLVEANGAEEATLLLAPTFADEPALGAARVLVRAPGG